MKLNVFGLAIAGMLVLGMPTQSVAQGGLFGFGPTIQSSSYLTQRDAIYNFLNPRPNTGVNNSIPSSARPGLEIFNRIVFRTTGVSRVTRFFGIF